MATGAADSWYHEKESAWLYGVVAATEPDPRKRDLFVKLAAAAEEQAACWLATRPELKPVFSPALRAWSPAHFRWPRVNTCRYARSASSTSIRWSSSAKSSPNTRTQKPRNWH